MDNDTRFNEIKNQMNDLFNDFSEKYKMLVIELMEIVYHKGYKEGLKDKE